MKPLLFALSLFSAAAFACGNPSSACGNGGCNQNPQIPLLEPISYALEQMQLEDNSDIRTAIHMYKKDVRSFEPTIPTEAFDGGHFSPGTYALNSPDAKMLKAQIDLFDTIYLILNDEQKKQFPIFLGMYQHHMKFINTPKMCDGGKKGCDSDKSKSCGPKSIKLIPKR
ncbi:MAG: hypothetical protein PHO27_05510 [Sulfuricurvum sp.]|nr:hypothetical protein [Sulfuricurvum sp.]